MPTELEQVCLDLSDKFLPKVNYARSFLDAEALSAVNRFELACDSIRIRRDPPRTPGDSEVK